MLKKYISMLSIVCLISSMQSAHALVVQNSTPYPALGVGFFFTSSKVPFAPAPEAFAKLGTRAIADLPLPKLAMDSRSFYIFASTNPNIVDNFPYKTLADIQNDPNTTIQHLITSPVGGGYSNIKPLYNFINITPLASGAKKLAITGTR